MFTKKANTKGSNVFSLGLVVFFVCTGGRHAPGETQNNRVNNLMRIKFTGSTKHLDLACAGPEAADLVRQALSADPRHRPGWSAARRVCGAFLTLQSHSAFYI